MASAATATDSYPSPVTSGDGESEDSLASTSKTGHKRAASEMDEEAVHEPRRDDSPAETPRMSVHLHKHKKERATVPREPQETIEAEASTDTTFAVECPVWPNSKDYKRKLSKGNLCTEREAPPLPEAAHLKVDFSVTPGSEWANMRRFKNAKFRDPFVHTYSAGQIVYVNRHWPVPPAPPANASEDEKLAFDRANFWVAVIAEFRAASGEKVYVKLFWFYWPEELPMGRQTYHGRQEVVLSNHVDIVDAQSIAGHTNISHWDETDDSNKVVLSELYWRQTFDLTKGLMGRRHALSKLRKFCICGGYDNPGLDMYQCHNVGCGMWNHQECLTTAFETRAWEMFKNGQLTHEVEVEDKHEPFAQNVADTVEPPVENSLGNTETKDEKKGKRRDPWAGKLNGKITTVQTSPNEITHRATVTQLVPAPDSQPEPLFQERIWNMELNCLRCQHPLN